MAGTRERGGEKEETLLIERAKYRKRKPVIVQIAVIESNQDAGAPAQVSFRQEIESAVQCQDVEAMLEIFQMSGQLVCSGRKSTRIIRAPFGVADSMVVEHQQPVSLRQPFENGGNSETCRRPRRTFTFGKEHRTKI